MNDPVPDLMPPPPPAPYPLYPRDPTAPPSRPVPRVPAQAPADGVSITAFVLALIGVATFGLACPVSLVLSIIGIARTDRRRGRGLAVTALVISLLGIAFLVLCVGALLYVGLPLWLEILAG